MTIMLLPERSVEDRLEEPRLEPQLDTLQTAISKESVLNEEYQLCQKNKSSEYATHQKKFFLVFLLILSERGGGHISLLT